MEIETMTGKFSVPDSLAESYKEMSDIDLLEALVAQNDRFLDPVLIQILLNRKLLYRGEKISDIKRKIQFL